MSLNQNAITHCSPLVDHPDRFRIVVQSVNGARVIDCGIHAAGGLEAGRILAETCMAGLGRVMVLPGDASTWTRPVVRVTTDHPVAACMASQYAGWPVQADDYFAMGSGPMRAARGREPLFDDIGHLEKVDAVVGVLESEKLPSPDACTLIATDCGIGPENVTLLVAPTTSLAGTIQVVARSIETALHKMHELKYDIARVTSGFGVAPLPPVAADSLTGIGRTNDAVLYGGEVTLWVDDDDDRVAEIGPKVPSAASADHGEPFAAVFEKYDRDFYKIDPLLFSPAVVTFVNLRSGRTFRFGEIRPDVLERSFGA